MKFMYSPALFPPASFLLVTDLKWEPESRGAQVTSSFEISFLEFTAGQRIENGSQ